MNRLFSILLGLVSFNTIARPIRVVVMDTGLSELNQSQLCLDGHKDFTGTSLKSSHFHGNHISDTIQQYASGNLRQPLKEYKVKNVNYCQIIIKIWNPISEFTADQSIKMTEQALAYVLTLPQVDIINFSG